MASKKGNRRNGGAAVSRDNGGATMEYGGRKIKLMRTPWWAPWGEKGEGPGAILAGTITNLFTGTEKTIGGRKLEAQHCLTVQTDDGEVLSVGCTSSLKWQLCECDEAGTALGWKPEVRVGAYVWIRYDGEGKAQRKGQSAPHLMTAGVGA